jgi:glycosyltransferase involved in cell wall biosynthesis
MDRSKIIVICLIPTRNNAPLMDRCLKSTGLWADVIIVCDQMSTDGTREIALKYPKVKLIDNLTVEYNESHRQKLLISEARKIEGQRLLITLDADEIFTPNVLTSQEWQTILGSEPGTIFKFQWANFAPGLRNMWLGYHFPWGYMDDGCDQNESKVMHNGRIPIPPSHDIIELNQIKVIHFQFVDWAKMQSKHRYYQCLETITYPDKSAVDIFRSYHHMLSVTKEQMIPIPGEWFEAYDKLGIDISSVYIETMNWFDEQGLKMIEQYGAARFRRLNIWDIDWAEKARLWGRTGFGIYKDPRSRIDKFVQSWLLKTQAKLHIRKYRRIDRLIKLVLKY